MRSLLCTVLIGLGAITYSQAPIPMTDFECRQAISAMMVQSRVADPAYFGAFSYSLLMDASETIGTRTTNVVSQLRWYDDSASPTSLMRGELWTTKNTLNAHRMVADGKRVWAYDFKNNDYSVSDYDGSTPPQNANYRRDFNNLFKQPVQGLPSYVVLLGEQMDTGQLKDWIGGVPFQGLDDQLGHRVMWQALPDNSRWVKFTAVEHLTGWILESVKVYKADRVGADLREVNVTITLGTLPDGSPRGVARNTPDFKFVPAYGARILANPRTIKF